MAKNDILESKSYRPNANLVQYILDELLMKEIRRNRENAGEDLSHDEKRFERNLNKRKSTWMNKIFQMTADLIFFLECIANKPELKEEFKDEYENLFGFSSGGEGSDSPERLFYSVEIHQNTVTRLISSILQLDITEQQDSTMIATYIAQEVAYWKMHNVLTESGMRYTDPEITAKIINDLYYNKAWIKFVTVGIDSRTHFRRIIDYNNPVLGEVKSRS
jgi:hypothetical protein